MAAKDYRSLDKEIDFLLKELKGNPFKTFNTAFFLIVSVPVIMTFYLFIKYSKLIGKDVIFVAVLTVALILATLGYYMGYTMIRKLLARVIASAILAKRRDREKAAMMTSIAHELGNPLSTLKVSLSNIVDGLLGKVNDDQQKVIRMCSGVTDRMIRLTRELLEVFKIEAGIVDAKRSCFTFQEAVEKQLEELSHKFSEKKITLRTNISEKNIPLWADETMISRVINNLLSNAVKYTAPGGEVTITLVQEKEDARLCVEDTGEGIPRDKIDSIFDKFTRLNKKEEGTGLGLAITKDMIELHKGKIFVESTVGKGSIFTVILPCDLRERDLGQDEL